MAAKPVIARVGTSSHKSRLPVGTPGRSSFDTAFELTRADDPDTVYARGAARCVWIDYAAGKSVPIPDRLRSTIEHAALVKAA